MKKILIIILSILTTTISYAQILTVTPENPSADDDVTIVFDAAQGNKKLKDYRGDIYAHTGVITGTAAAPSSWKYIQGEWGRPDYKVRMKKLGNNKYQIKFNIREFYNIPLSDQFLQMVFVFRTANGDRVAKTEDDQDIAYPPIDLAPNGILEENSGKNATLLSEYISDEAYKNGRIFRTKQGAVLLEPFADNILKVAFFADGKVKSIQTDAIAKKTPMKRKINYVESEEEVLFSWGSDAKVQIDKSPMRMSFLYGDKEMLADAEGFYMHQENNVAGFRLKKKAKEHYYGYGPRAIPIDHAGQRLYAYNTATHGYTNGQATLNLTVPFVLSSENYGIFVDEPHRCYFDFGSVDKNVLEFGAKATEDITYYVIFGNSPADILEQYTALTGRQPLPPLWALGYIQSRFGYESQEAAEEVVEKTLKANLPIDALVLDLYWFGQIDEMGNFDWDKEAFPYPKRMVKNFKKKGIKTILITEPYFTKKSAHFKSLKSQDYFAKDSEGDPYVLKGFWAGHAGLLDMFKEDAREWLWKQYKPQIELGVAGWWCDLGEPETHPLDMVHETGTAEEVHNLYPLEWAKLLSDKYEKEYPDTRLFNLARSGFAGMQRYSTFPWSGDIERSWKGLKAQLPIMLASSMSGIGYMHSDIGGFTGGQQNPELYVRWMQFGTFAGIMRTHGAGIPTEPIYYDTKTQNIARTFLNLRYKLLPYNYTLAWENSTKGAPLARPLHYAFPQDENLHEAMDAYLWGNDILVNPVTRAAASSQKLYLPKGKWVNYWTDEIHSGKQTIDQKIVLETIPLYIRAGSFIPMAPKLKNTSEYTAEKLYLHYYPDRSAAISSGHIFLDDGQSPNSLEKQAYLLTDITALVKKNAKIAISLRSSGKGFEGMPKKQAIILVAHRIQKPPKKVAAGGKATLVDNLDALETIPKTYFWDEKTQRLYIHLEWNPAAGSKATVSIAGKAILE